MTCAPPCRALPLLGGVLPLPPGGVLPLPRACALIVACGARVRGGLSSPGLCPFDRGNGLTC
eukprot:3387991-Alexandrium_andersonii.AAC.1